MIPKVSKWFETHMGLTVSLLPVRGSNPLQDLDQFSRFSLVSKACSALGSLIARKFSLLRRLGNSFSKRLNFPPKAEAPRLSQNRRMMNFPVFSRVTGKQARGDEFADDCFLRQFLIITNQIGGVRQRPQAGPLRH